GGKTEGDDRRRAHRRASRGIRIPVFESVRLQNIRLDLIDTPANRTFQVQLRRLSIDDARDSDALFVNGLGSINGNEFSLEGRVGALAAILEGKEPVPVAFDFQAAGFHVSLSGTVEDMLAGKGMALRLTGKTGELATLLGMLNIRTPPLGGLKFQARVSRDVDAPRLSDLSVTLSGDAGLEFALTGAVDDAVSGKGADLRFTAACDAPQVLTTLVPSELPEIQHIRVEGTLREASGVLSAENLAIRIDAAQGLSAGAGGRIGLGAGFKQMSPTDLDIDIELSVPDAHILREYGVEWPVDLGRLNARARLTGPIEGLALEDIDIASGGDGPLRLTSQGRVGHLSLRPAADRRISQIDLRTTLQADTTQALAAGFGLDWPELGAVALNTRIHGASDRLHFSDIDGRTASAKGLQIKVSGLVDLHSDPSGRLLGKLDVQVLVAAPSAAVAIAPFGRADLPELKPFRASARIGGSFEALSADRIELSAGQSGPLRLEISGNVGKLPLDGRPASDVILNTVLEADSTAAFSSAGGRRIPDLGTLKASAGLRDRNGSYGVPELRLVLRQKKGAELTVTGRIASLLRSDRFFMEGVSLTATVQNFLLNPLFDEVGPSLSDLGPLTGRFQVAGNSEALSISKAALTALSPLGSKIEATGSIDRIRLSGAKPLGGLNLSLRATAPGWSALPMASGLGLPDAGPLQVKATITGGSGSFDVESFELLCGKSQQDLLRFQGQILGIGGPDRMALTAAFDAASLPWLTDEGQHSAAIKVPLRGVLQVVGDADGFHIDAFRIDAEDGKLLTVRAGGRIPHGEKPADIDIQLQIDAPDPRRIGSMAGVALPLFGPLTIDGRIGGNPRKPNFSGETRFGDTQIQSSISADFTAQRPVIVAGLTSDTLHLEDLGITPAPPPEAISIPAKALPPPKDMIFDDKPLALNALKFFDLDLELDAATVLGQDIRIENLNLDITLENGRLRVSPARMMYAAGFTEAHFVLDASGPVPVFELKATGDGIDVEDLLARVREPIFLSGKLGLSADLRSVGRSNRELASNLEGKLRLTIDNGRVRRIVNFLSTDAMNLVFAGADPRRHTDLNCLAGEIQFQEGVGNVEVFVMDTPRIRARAAGSVDLASETIDIVINPEYKRRLFRRRTSAVRVAGSLARPSYRTIPLEEAVRLYGTLLIPHIFLTERLLGDLWYRIRRDRDASPCEPVPR
ncbi:MAG: AsmA-like C-terminal region-containing protein, partial [Desulfobacterales bacterium]